MRDCPKLTDEELDALVANKGPIEKKFFKVMWRALDAIDEAEKKQRKKRKYRW